MITGDRTLNFIPIFRAPAGKMKSAYYHLILKEVLLTKLSKNDHRKAQFLFQKSKNLPAAGVSSPDLHRPPAAEGSAPKPRL